MNRHETCMCGHVRGHHSYAALGGQQCEWRSCGCPRFITPGEDPQVSPSEQPAAKGTPDAEQQD